MNCIISIVSPQSIEELMTIHSELSVPVSATFLGRGTASRSMLDLLGIESNKKRIVISVANTQKSLQLIHEIKRRLYIGIPRQGVVVSMPIKSIGGGKMVNILSEGEMPAKQMPQVSDMFELIIIISNEGRTDDVMNAARHAGAAGGTVLHGKGTTSEEMARFLNLSITSEKEVILIVAKKEQKTEIMRAVLEKAGPGTKAGAIIFSLPVSSVAGIGMSGDE